MRATNPRLSGLMPFTILFRNWVGVQSFDQMGHNANADQMTRSYSPVLLSWENWTPNVYAGTKLSMIAHVVNDAEDFSDLAGATLAYEVRDRSGKVVPNLGNAFELPMVKYYGTWRAHMSIDLPASLPTGRYTVYGIISRQGERLAENSFDVFVAGDGWKRGGLAGAADRRVQLYDPDGDTAVALDKLDIKFDLTDLQLVRDGVPLVVGEAAWPRAKVEGGLKKWVTRGNRVLLLRQSPAAIDGASWLPVKVNSPRTSNNDPTYEKRQRPTRDGMHVNPERPWHPVLKGVERDRLEWWSDYTGWDQSKPGFPAIYPVGNGFRLTRPEDLARTAIIANYDRGLEAVAIAEMFDGKGSVVMTGLDLVPRVGKDPVADRVLRNLVSYVASTEPREVHPLVERPIVWGDYPSERGVVVEPIGGLVVNCRWQVPPTAPDAKPLPDNEGAWNTRPGDGFLPHRRRVFGPWTYTNATGIRDLSDPAQAAAVKRQQAAQAADGGAAETNAPAAELDDVDNAPVRRNAKASPAGAGEFWARIPAGRRWAVTKVENPGDKPAKITVQVNGSKPESIEVPAGASDTVKAPIDGGATDVNVKFTADKVLVLLETSFE